MEFVLYGWIDPKKVVTEEGICKNEKGKNGLIHTQQLVICGEVLFRSSFPVPVLNEGQN